MLKYIVAVFSFFAIVVPSSGAGAMASVGIGTAKIEIGSPIEAGISMKLDSIAVYNDGDETGSFEMEVMFNETQVELKPESDWIIFSPALFELEPGASQIVEVTISLPDYAESGEYFAYLEAHLIKEVAVGGEVSTTISAAAATKFLFATTKTVKQEVQAVSLPTSAGKTKDVTSIFEQSNKDYMASNVTINKLLSFSTIL